MSICKRSALEMRVSGGADKADGIGNASVGMLVDLNDAICCLYFLVLCSSLFCCLFWF